MEKNKRPMEEMERHVEDEIMILCELKFEKLSTVTLHTQDKFIFSWDDKNPYKISIDLREIPGNYQLVTVPEAKNIPLSGKPKKNQFVWKIIPLKPEFELVFYYQGSRTTFAESIKFPDSETLQGSGTILAKMEMRSIP